MSSTRPILLLCALSLLPSLAGCGASEPRQPRPAGHVVEIGGQEVVVEIAKTGKLVRHKVLKQSGNRIFDDSVLTAIQDSMPLPPLPPCFQGRSWSHIFEFVPDEGRQG